MNFLLKLLPVETIIRYIGKVLTNQDDKLIDYIFNKVEELDKNSKLSGYEKRQKLYEEIKQQSNQLADWAINLLIELAVAYYRYKQSK